MKPIAILPGALLVFGVIVEAALALYAPLGEVIIAPYNLIGLGIIALGLLFAIYGIATLVRHKTTAEPGAAPRALATNGPFKVTRNPTYVGGLLILLGVGLHLNATSAFVMPLAYFLAMNFYVIPVEEKILRKHFAREYDEYAKRVRRWI